MGVPTSSELPPDLFILSDLHLSAGLDERSGRTARLETFFYDREFANLVDRIIVHGTCRRRRVVVILNGDAFDFLAVVRLPTPEEQKELGFRISRRERKYGLDSEPRKDAWKMRLIIRGHEEFFRALLRLIGAGHRVHVNRGNHDIELFWPEVQEVFHEELLALAERSALPVAEESLAERFCIHPWFYYEPGRIWVEHGHQYEASNSLRFQLNPVLARRTGGMGSTGGPTLDLPTGSLFVRHVYNRFKLVDPYSTQVFTLEQYLDVVSTYNVIDLARTVVVNFPFFTRALRKARIFEVSGKREVQPVHVRNRERLAEQSGLGDKLATIDAMREYPLGVTKYTLFREMMKPFARGVATAILIVLVAIGGWMFLFSMIQNTPWLAESVLGKASLMAVLAVVTIVGLFLSGTYLSRRYRHVTDTLHDTMEARAGDIADLLGVKLVSMGHSHMAERRPIAEGRAEYANSGTWTHVRGPWDTVRPAARQFTFHMVQDDELSLLRWNDAAGRWEPVTLLEDFQPTGLDRIAH